MRVDKNTFGIKMLRLSGDREEITIKDGDEIRVVTDGTEFDEVIEGSFEFIDENTICVDDEMIKLEYIKEISLL